MHAMYVHTTETLTSLARYMLHTTTIPILAANEPASGIVILLDTLAVGVTSPTGFTVP